MSVAAPEVVRPRWCWVPPAAVSSAGPLVVEFAASFGRHLDAEQALAVGALLSERADGRWAALEGALVCSRQNLKTFCFEAIALAAVYVLDARLVIWSAHLFDTAQESFRNLDQLVTSFDHLRRRVKAVSRANGEEGIELVDGSRIKFKARSKSGGRGLSAPMVILDEAFALTPGHMGALLPTLSAQPNPLVLYGSSAGLPESGVLRGVRDRGRAGNDPSLAYVEWASEQGSCAAGKRCEHTVNPPVPGCALDDEGKWREANPALRKRISVSYVRAERRALPAAEFARERLGWWDDPVDAARQIDPAAWDALAQDAPVPGGVPVFCVDVSYGMASASIAAAVDDAGRVRVELAAHRAGVDWLIERCRDLAERHPGARWVAFTRHAASAVVPQLAEAGIEVQGLSDQDMGRACGHLQQLVAERGLSHAGDPVVRAALAGAVPRDVGEGLWAWGRRKSGVDICPLVAVTGAVWGLRSGERVLVPLVARA